MEVAYVSLVAHWDKNQDGSQYTCAGAHTHMHKHKLTQVKKKKSIFHPLQQPITSSILCEDDIHV